MGDGVYRSTDGDETWQHRGLRDGQQIPALLVDPRDPRRVFAAVLGHPYGPNAERGVFRSADGGESWQKVLYRDEDTGAVDLAFDPADPDTVYAVLWAARQAPCTHDYGATWSEATRGIPQDEVVNAVREDPVRRGLLFAATEQGVYVSWNDGDDWQSLRLNLPATSVRDLVVHGDDLVVATHGRSFWILDGIATLRQLDAGLAAEAARLFRPAAAVRVRRNLNTDTPLPPEEPAGRNPPDGALLDYFLREPAAGPVTLEVLDAAGRLVRRFASTDEPEPIDPQVLAIPTYWIRPPRTLSAGPGLHRFVWDLRYPPPDALERGYPISAIVHDTPAEPLGPFVLPGEYQVRLVSPAAPSCNRSR